MNPETLRQKLLAAARTYRPSEDVPYAFEKRIMARLGRLAPPDPWSAWGAALWRALAPCAALMLMVGIGTFILPSSSEDLGSQLDAVLIADLDVAGDAP